MHPDADTQAIVDYLLRERRQLLAAPTKDGALEANRLALTYWQRRRPSTGIAAARGAARRTGGG
jgi:hypothetical protein